MDQDRFDRWLKGDEGAFAQIYADYRSCIVRFITAMVCDSAVGEDLAQETFLRLHRARDRLSEEGVENGRALLYSIARRLAFNHASYRRRWSLLIEEMADGHSTLSVRDSTPEDLFQAAELGVQVHSAIDALPAPQRELILLRHLEELAYAEIATVLGCSIGQVRTRLQYARKLLRARLVQMGLQPE